MTVDGGAFDGLPDRIRRLSDGATGARFRTTWSEIGADVVVTVASTADAGDTMTVRMRDDGALLDVDDADAIEFSSDDEDTRALTAVVDAFFRGELGLVVGARDGKCHGVRAGEVELISSAGLLGRLRSGGRRVRSTR